MTAWWNSLNLTQQIFALFAVPATVILIIQTLLLLFGLGGHHDGDYAGDAHLGDVHELQDHPDAITGHELQDHPDAITVHDPGLRLFTVRGLVAFFAVGGWVGIALIDLQITPVPAAFLAMLAGLLALIAVAWLLRLMLKLQSSGNQDIRNAVGCTGVVYLHIPGAFKGTGKVTLILQEQSVELDALTENPEGIATGRQIKVIGVRGDLLIVQPLGQ
ncbi:MAG: hypothetical protein VB070_15575 [Clostridiaceae bacterium]|nr:hypothetical protein [Clostridiaceae bacterium]